VCVSVSRERKRVIAIICGRQRSVDRALDECPADTCTVVQSLTKVCKVRAKRIQCSPPASGISYGALNVTKLGRASIYLEVGSHVGMRAYRMCLQLYAVNDRLT